MGRRSGDPEGDGTGLAEDHSGDILKFAADLLDQGLTCFGVRLAAVLPLGHQRFDTRRGRGNEPFRAFIEPALPRFASLVPGSGDRLIVDRACAKPAVDQP